MTRLMIILFALIVIGNLFCPDLALLAIIVGIPALAMAKSADDAAQAANKRRRP